MPPPTKLAVRFAASTRSEVHAVTQHLPMPRATTAACEVSPPRAVRIPAAAFMPWMSSGEVSVRTSSTRSPRLAHSSAAVAVNTIRPIAAPGDAGSPLPIAGGRAFGSIVGCSTSSSLAGSTRITASAGESLPSATRSTATFTIALPVRLPLRACSMNSRPRSIVNSRSCMSRKWSSSCCATRRSSACAAGCFFASSPSGSGVRMPATTSSPWALVRNSP